MSPLGPAKSFPESRQRCARPTPSPQPSAGVCRSTNLSPGSSLPGSVFRKRVKRVQLSEQPALTLLGADPTKTRSPHQTGGQARRPPRIRAQNLCRLDLTSEPDRRIGGQSIRWPSECQSTRTGQIRFSQEWGRAFSNVEKTARFALCKPAHRRRPLRMSSASGRPRESRCRNGPLSLDPQKRIPAEQGFHVVGFLRKNSEKNGPTGCFTGPNSPPADIEHAHGYWYKRSLPCQF